MKIYEIGTGYTPIPAQIGAATEIVVEELTKAFMKLGQDVEIIDIKASNRAENDLPIVEVAVPRFFSRTDLKLGLIHKLKRVSYSVALAFKLKKILKKTDERVVLHFHNQYNMFFFLLLVPEKYRKKALLAYTNHSGVWRLRWEDVAPTIRKRYFQEAKCMRMADVVFVLNDETAQNVINHLGVENKAIVKIDNGVNTEIYRPLDKDEIVRVKHQLGLENKKIILQVGSVYENKGQARVVEGIAPLLQSNGNYVYAYVGGIVSDEYQETVKKVACDLGIEEQVHYLGIACPGEKLNELYNAAQATIIASEYESFGMVIIESLSTGTPVLLAENFPQPFGEGTVLYKMNCLLDAICQTEKQEGLEVKARNNALANYSWHKVAQDYLDAFRS